MHPDALLPNLPDEDLKPGGKENNEPLRYFGEPTVRLSPKHHVDLCTDLGFIDYTGGEAGRSGFWMYTGLGPAEVGSAELLH